MLHRRLAKTRILLTAAIAILATGCGGGGGGLFSDPGDQISLSHRNLSATTGTVTGIAIAQIDVENESPTRRTLSLSLNGTDAHYFLTNPENDPTATANPATITFAGSGIQTVYVAILCIRPDDTRPITLRISDSLGSNEIAVDNYQCDPLDIQFSAEQNIADSSVEYPITITPDASDRFVYRLYPITTDLPRPPPEVFNLDNLETVDIEVIATPEGATENQQITVWLAPHDPEAAERSSTPQTTLSIPFERQDAQRAVVHWSCPEAPGEHTLRGTVHARLASSRFEWESERVPYHQVCLPPQPPVIVLLPPGQPLRARLSERAVGEFQIVNRSPITRNFTVEITPSTDAAFQVNVPGNRRSLPISYGIPCGLHDAKPTIEIEVGDAFTEGVVEPPSGPIQVECAGLPISVFPRPLNLRSPPIAPIDAGGLPVIAAQQFSVNNRASSIPGVSSNPEFTMSFNNNQCDPKGGPCVWTQNEWNAICPRLPCTINAFDSRTPSPEHAIPAGQVTTLVLTAPCDGKTPLPSPSVPVATRLDGEPVPNDQDLPPIHFSVSCEGQATGPDDIRIVGPDRIEARGWEYAEGFIHIANESRAAIITPTINIAGPGEFLDGRTTTTLPTIAPQATRTLEYRAPCPDGTGNFSTDYDIRLSLQDPAKDFDVTLTCAPAALSVSLPLPRLHYEPPVEVRDPVDNGHNIRIDKNSLRLDAYAWGQFQVAAHLDASKLIPQLDVEGVRWDWSQIQSASDLIITDQAGWTEWRNAAHQHRVTVNDFINSIEALDADFEFEEAPACDTTFPLRPLEPCVPTRPAPPQALESIATEDSGQRNLYIYWACPDPNQESEELAEEEGTLTIHASKGGLRSRPFSQTIRKACETTPRLDPINQFLVHQGLVVQHDQAPGPIESLRNFARYLSIEIHHPSDWDLDDNLPRLVVTQVVEEGGGSQRPSPGTMPVEFEIDLQPEVPVATQSLLNLALHKSVAIYKIDEPAENRDLTIRIRFDNVPNPPFSGSGANRYDTDQEFRIRRPRLVEGTNRPIHVLGGGQGLWNRSDPTDEERAHFFSDLARRVPLIPAEESTFNHSSPYGGNPSAHELLRDFAHNADHPADWVFVPTPTERGRPPDEWPLGTHEGANYTGNVQYARVALVPEPRIQDRQMPDWPNYANDLDAWSYAVARWLDAGEPTYPAVTWLNLITDTSSAEPFRVQDFFRPNDAHDINDRSTDAATDTADSMGVPSVPTWERMMVHLQREPARDSQESQGSHILVASQTAGDAEAEEPPPVSLVLDQDSALPDWGANPQPSGGNRHWRVVYFTAADMPSMMRPEDNTFSFACGEEEGEEEDVTPPPPSAISADALAAYPGIRRHQIDVPITTFDGLTTFDGPTSSNVPVEAKGIAWRLPLPDNAGECGDDPMTPAQCPIRQVHIQTNPRDNQSWHCFGEGDF